jgi:hypothetical protein
MLASYSSPPVLLLSSDSLTCGQEEEEEEEGGIVRDARAAGDDGSEDGNGEADCVLLSVAVRRGLARDDGGALMLRVVREGRRECWCSGCAAATVCLCESGRCGDDRW